MKKKTLRNKHKRADFIRFFELFGGIFAAHGNKKDNFIDMKQLKPNELIMSRR